MDAIRLWARWYEPLLELGRRIRDVTRASLEEAEAAGHGDLREITGRGEGDWTFGLDVAPEAAVRAWHEEVARTERVSVFTEDAGWRHLGPDAQGGYRELDDFPDDAPRVVIDPIDGTRPLMWGLASAWASVALANGHGAPRSGDLCGGVLVEIPPVGRGDSAWWVAGPDGPVSTRAERLGSAPGPWRAVSIDDDDRVDRGFFPVVRYHPLQRPALANLEAAFWSRVARAEGARLDVVWDDQVCSNVAQILFVVRGLYRMCVDGRALLNDRLGTDFTTSKPYDVAASVHVARRAGVRIERADGEPLDFPLDATTPVQFAAYHNEPTRVRLRPHWLAAVASEIEAP